MSMRPLSFGSPPFNGSTADKLDYCMRALAAIQTWSNENSAADIAKGFTVTNLTLSRTFDADTANVAALSDIVGTFLTDLKNRGSKRT